MGFGSVREYSTRYNLESFSISYNESFIKEI